MNVLYIVILVLVVYLIYKKPGFLGSSNKDHDPRNLTKEDKYNIEKKSKEKELDLLLEKIHKKGYENLSTREKQRLKELSK